MGRPKGSKNKPKVDEKVQPTLMEIVKDGAKRFDKKPYRASIEAKNELSIVEQAKPKKVIKPLSNTDAAKVYIKAAVDLAMTGARNYIVDKVTAWKAARMGELKCDTSADGQYDTYRLIDDNGDEVDSITIQHVDVEYVVKQILGLE